MAVDPGTLVAVYAAVVATGALALEVRRWFESGPKIYVKASPNMTLLDGVKETPDLLVVNVVNRGDTPTTIINFGLLDYPNAWGRWRRKPARSFVIPHPQPPGSPPVIPQQLSPGQRWMGMADHRPDILGDIQTGRMWAAIYTTDRDRPYMARIPKRQPEKELKDAKKL
ncbi:hypothetical protein FJ942_17050 [Mesorhizobium sp. B2-4-2]|uniref:hypothetical protein n=1 Tax=Mesorhizobium sp. B2-4-2 TaxID=2589947 RepID=UPI0011274506|nr:hypothetical protein [Mesorhizobium sp. B2-4-2]TPL55413.1 hypothetical protein FJ942_17050 [Mesorhizobium sp. B2-4-2]